MSRKAKLGFVSTMTAFGLVIAATGLLSKVNSRGSLTSRAVADAVDGRTLAAAAEARVFFGHQSVGANLIDGVERAYDAKGMTPPGIIELSSRSSPPSTPHGGGFFAHSFIGANGDPVAKLEDFDTMLRSGLAQEVDVAMMKFCYVDVTAGTDINALFDTYEKTLGALERDFPQVTFLHVTTPLMTAPRLRSRLKSVLGGGSPGAADNAARERLNTLMRKACGGDHLFDLAALESTAPDGSTVTGSHEGQTFYSLYGGYAVDEGHLTPAFAELAASEMLADIARATA